MLMLLLLLATLVASVALELTVVADEAEVDSDPVETSDSALGLVTSGHDASIAAQAPKKISIQCQEPAELASAAVKSGSIERGVSRATVSGGSTAAGQSDKLRKNTTHSFCTLLKVVPLPLYLLPNLPASSTWLLRAPFEAAANANLVVTDSLPSLLHLCLPSPLAAPALHQPPEEVMILRCLHRLRSTANEWASSRRRWPNDDDLRNALLPLSRGT